MNISELIKIIPQYLIPHHLLSSVMYKITRCRTPAFKNLIIQQVIKHYAVDMDDAVESDYRNFASFNEFFTRELKPEKRPLCENVSDIACPVDGTVSQAGDIKALTIFQAKNHDYSLGSLLANDESVSEFKDGKFATLYLSPRDYHRIHCPIDGKLRKMIHVPGKLFSVNNVTVNNVPALFARNERVICLFDTSLGPMAVILVGAIFVSSMETVWAGTVTPPAGKQVRTWDYDTRNITLKKGDELGRFNMGSTVILLFGKDVMQWHETLKHGTSIKMGQCIGTATNLSH